MPECELNPTPEAKTFSPDLRKAVQEVLDVCRKHDIGAYFVLCAKEHVEIRTRFPSWSLVHVEAKDGRTGIRIKAKGNATLLNDPLSWTINMITSFFEQPARMALDMDGVMRMLKANVDFDTKTFKGPDAPPWDFR